MKLDNYMDSKHKNGLLSSTYFMRAVLASYSKVRICQCNKLLGRYHRFNMKASVEL